MLRKNGRSFLRIADRLVRLVSAAVILLACSDQDEPANPAPIPVASVSVTPGAGDLGPGQTVQLTAAALAANGDTLKQRQIAWSSTVPTVASVSATGVVTAHTGGIAVIEAVSESRKGTALITVNNPAPAATTLQPASIQAGNNAFDLTVTGTNFVTGSTVHWNGAARPTTFVSATQLRAQVTAVDIGVSGTAQVSVHSPLPGGGQSGALAFQITPGVAEIVRVEVAVGTQVLWLGETLQLTATAYDAQNRPVNTGPVIWQTTNTSAVMISASGLATATGEGNATIEANIAGKLGYALLHVWRLPPTYDIVFESTSAGLPTLYVATPGSNLPPRRLLPSGMPAIQPAVSADGNRVAFAGADAFGNRNIYVVDRDGTNLRRLTTLPGTDDARPAWSPDGSKIAFQSFRGGFRDIFVINADASGERNITAAPIRVGVPSHSHPSWSSDNNTIVFSMTDVSIQPNESRIFAINADGSNPRPLTTFDGYSDVEPAYSRDGSMIAFRKSHPQHGQQIAIMRPDGEQLYYFYPPGPGFTPRWAPNGEWLTFVSSENQSAASDVYVWKVGAYGRKRVTTAGGTNPAFIRR